MANPNAQVTMTQREKWALERKAKSGWRAFYQQREQLEEVSQERNQYRGMADALRQGGEVDVTHLKRMFLELYARVGELVDCPVCYEPLTKDNTFIPNCAHLMCKACRPRIQNNKCPTCRKDLGAPVAEVAPPPAPVDQQRDEEDIPLAQLRRRA
jgi:hypothetical protein